MPGWSFLYQGRNTVAFLVPPDRPFDLQARRFDAPGGSIQVVSVERRDVEVFAVISIPDAGCWEFWMPNIADNRLVEYVYPYGCRPPQLRVDPPPSPLPCPRA